MTPPLPSYPGRLLAQDTGLHVPSSQFVPLGQSSSTRDPLSQRSKRLAVRQTAVPSWQVSVTPVVLLVESPEVDVLPTSPVDVLVVLVVPVVDVPVLVLVDVSFSSSSPVSDPAVLSSSSWSSSFVLESPVSESLPSTAAGEPEQAVRRPRSNAE